MAYALQNMLKIRTMREDRASTELNGARRARNAAEAERNQRQEALDDFNLHKDERRDRIFATVMGRTVSMDALDNVRDAVAQVDEEGMLLGEARAKAQQLLEKRTEEANAARIRYLAALKNKMKIEEHRAVWIEEEKKLQEKAQDAEMEEFTGKKIPTENDDALD